MANLQRYDNEGLELIIDLDTGEVYATQGMIAKLTITSQKAHLL